MSRHWSRIRTVAGLGGLGLMLVAAGAGACVARAADTAPVPLAPTQDVLISQDRNPIIGRNSPTVVVNPAQRTNMVVVDRVDRPDYTAGVHVSNDGGGNWQDVALKSPTGNKGKLFAATA